MLASVIIPTKNRTTLLSRAVQSIISSKNSDQVEIIVVDDNSDERMRMDFLRSHDQVIYLISDSGAAVARNVGIAAARGKVIYLLDSDDYFVERDFVRDSQFALNTSSLCYSEIESQLFKSNFPSKLLATEFFDSIFFRNKHIGQTSSLYFKRELNLRFDESLPKHQDWDFILFSALLSGIEVIKGTGTIYFDRSDRGSLSRKKGMNKSIVWFEKLKKWKIGQDTSTSTLVKFYLFAEYTNLIGNKEFLILGSNLLLKKKLSLIAFLKKIYYRYF